MKPILLNGKMEEADLMLFIKNKIDSYEEPVRKGTPRGEPIGFSKSKYAAALYGLSNLKLKEIGKKLRVSVSLLTKWRSEKAFKEEFEKNMEEFSKRFFEKFKMFRQMETGIFEWSMMDDPRYKGFLREFAKDQDLEEDHLSTKGTYVRIIYNLDKEFSTYGDKLLVLIVFLFKKDRDEATSPEAGFGAAMNMLYLIDSFHQMMIRREKNIHRKGLLEGKAKVFEIQKMLAIETGVVEKHSAEILAKDEINLQDRKFLEIYFQGLFNTIEKMNSLLNIEIPVRQKKKK